MGTIDSLHHHDLTPSTFRSTHVRTYLCQAGADSTTGSSGPQAPQADLGRRMTGWLLLVPRRLLKLVCSRMWQTRLVQLSTLEFEFSSLAAL